MDADGAAALVRDVGFPIVAAMATGWALWAVGRFALGSIYRKLRDLEKLTLEQRTIIVQLIDRVRSLEDLQTRTHVLVRTLADLGVELDAIGRNRRQSEE